jgi:hypothetical protein
MNDHGAGRPAPYPVPRAGDQDPEGPPDRNDIRPPSPDPAQNSRDMAEPATAKPATAKRGAVVLDALDYGLAAIAGIMVVFVHDVHYLLTAPYWMDEAWVADSLRVPLGQVARLASSTPYGWTLLLRLVPGSGLERQRIVPLAFAALAVAFGYLLGRELRLTRFAAGLLTAAAVLLSPAMLVRDDLKQYTAEACAAVLLWLLVARLENAWTRWRLAALALTTALATLVAETAIITGGAAFACLTLEAVIRRQWRRLAEVAVAGAGMLAVYSVIFVVLVLPRVNPRLSTYWAPLYSPASVTGAARFFWTEFSQRLGPYIGFPGTVPKTFTRPATAAELVIPLILAVAGIVALALLRRFALAAMFPVTLVVVMVGSMAHQYPFGDERTSTFWIVMVPVLMAIAVAAAIHGLGRLCLWLRRLPGGTWLAVGARAAIAVTVGTAAIAGYLHEVQPDVNAHQITHEDVRSQVAYVEAHFRPGDVIIADYGTSYGFAYYYPQPATAYPQLLSNATGFIPQYPGNPRIIVLSTFNPPALTAALRQARAVLAAEPAAPRSPTARGRIWILMQHTYKVDDKRWQALFDANMQAGGTVTRYRLNKLGYKPGFESVWLYVLPPAHRPPAHSVRL